MGLIEQGETEISCCLLDRLAEVRRIDTNSFPRLVFMVFKHQSQLYQLQTTYPELSEFHIIGDSDSGFSERALDYRQST